MLLFIPCNQYYNACPTVFYAIWKKKRLPLGLTFEAVLFINLLESEKSAISAVVFHFPSNKFVMQESNVNQSQKVFNFLSYSDLPKFHLAIAQQWQFSLDREHRVIKRWKTFFLFLSNEWFIVIASV